MRVGIIGCGAVACYCHIPALRRLRGVTIVAAADPSEAARERARRAVPVALHARAEELLERDDVDAVIISAPSHLHAEIAVKAATAGKHFYLEKPVATTGEDARLITNAVLQAGVIAATGFNRRLHPLYEQARTILASGRFGNVRAVQTTFSEPAPEDGMPDWKRSRHTGGGVLLDLASHHFDLLRWLLDDEIEAISASVRSEESEHDSARVELSMRGGVEAQSFFSFRAGFADFLEFICERGTLRVDRHRSSLTALEPRRMGYGARRHWIAPRATNAMWRLRRVWRPSEDPSYMRSLRAFVEHAAGGPRRGAALEDGVRSLDAVLAAEESARTGSLVSLAAR